jgi:hypothetical protein
MKPTRKTALHDREAGLRGRLPGKRVRGFAFTVFPELFFN